MQVTFGCSARGDNGSLAAAIGLTQCYLQGLNGVRFNAADTGSSPGNATARVGDVANAPAQKYRVCRQAAGLWMTGGNFFQTTLVCSPYA